MPRSMDDALTAYDFAAPPLIRFGAGRIDEIGEMGLDEQAMLLRAIEEQRFLPVGADQEAESDFQLIAGTNRDEQTEP